MGASDRASPCTSSSAWRAAAPRPRSRTISAQRLVRGRETVDAMVAEGAVVYGVTTGFGDLSSVRIDAADAAQLQLNLVRSHAIGVGEPLPAEVVRGMLLLLANSLSKGHSGVRARARRAAARAARARRRCRSCRAAAPSGASGDLAPLAHIAVVLCGEGRATLRRRGARRRRGAAARRARADRAGREGGPRADQRHAPDGGLRRPRAARRAPAARCGRGHRGALARGLHGLDRRRSTSASTMLRRQPGQGAVAARAARPARGQRDRREPRRLRARAGSVHAALRAAGARRDRRRARLRRGRAGARARRRHRQPAALPGRRRGLLGRQLPRAAALARARSPRARPVRARVVRRAAHLRAALAELRRAARASSRRTRASPRA